MDFLHKYAVLLRVIHLCDSYLYRHSCMVYRLKMDQETAMAELRRCSGTRFDSGVVEVFLKVLEKRLKKVFGGFILEQ